MTIVSIEGNIGCGKSTMLNKLRHLAETRLSQNKMKVLTEPVDEWAALLDRSYNDPSRWCFTVNVKVLMSLKEWFPQDPSAARQMFITERSPLCSRFVFAAVHKTAGTMDALEGALFEEVCEKTGIWNPDAVIYVRTDPEVCYERLRLRDRACEKTLTFDYLTLLHDQHERVFVDRAIPPQVKVPDIRIVNGNRHPDVVFDEVLEILKNYE